MIEWKEQGAAAVATLVIGDGRRGSVVLVAPRGNAKGATLVFPDPVNGKQQMAPLHQMLDMVRPTDLVEILAMQERLFGNAGLPRPDGFTVGNM